MKSFTNPIMTCQTMLIIFVTNSNDHLTYYFTGPMWKAPVTACEAYEAYEAKAATLRINLPPGLKLPSIVWYFESSNTQHKFQILKYPLVGKLNFSTGRLLLRTKSKIRKNDTNNYGFELSLFSLFIYLYYILYL